MTHYDVTTQYLVFNIAHFVEVNRSYHLAKFHWLRLSGSDFTRAGGKHSSPDLHALKKPSSPYRVKNVIMSVIDGDRGSIPV